MLLLEYMGSVIGLLSVSEQLNEYGEPGGDEESVACSPPGIAVSPPSE